MFNYRNWSVWYPPALVAMARILGLNVVYCHADSDEFMCVDDIEGVEESDCLDNVTFMAFTRHPID